MVLPLLADCGQICDVIHKTWGPIYRISYDNLTIMPKLRTTYGGRLISNIGADSTGATGYFAPVLTQEPGQTLRFAPVPLHGCALIFKV